MFKLTVTLADTMFEFLLTVVMVGMWLLNARIDSEHRAKALEVGPKPINPLTTRTPKENWIIHPAWVQRYLFCTCMFPMYIRLLN